MLKGEVKCTTMRRRGPSYPSYPSWLGPHGPLWGVFQWDGAVISTGAPALCLFSDSSTLLVAPTVQIFNPWNWPELTRVVNVVRNWLRSTPTPPLTPIPPRSSSFFLRPVVSLMLLCRYPNGVVDDWFTQSRRWLNSWNSSELQRLDRTGCNGNVGAVGSITAWSIRLIDQMQHGSSLL